MAFTEIQSLDADVTVAIGGFNKKTRKDNPTSVEGYYLGSRKVESKKAKNGFAYIHIFQTPKGNLGVWGKTDMDRKLLTATPGTMVRVSFDRMQPTPNGEMYKFKVEVDSANTIHVDLQPAVDTTSSFTSGNSYNDGDDSGESEETETTAADTSALDAAAAKQAAQRAKVQALLNKNK